MYKIANIFGLENQKKDGRSTTSEWSEQWTEYGAADATRCRVGTVVAAKLVPRGSGWTTGTGRTA